MTDECTSGDKNQKFEDYYDGDSAPIAENSNIKSNYNINDQSNFTSYQSTTNPETPYYYTASENKSNENNMNNNSNLQTSKIKLIIQYILSWILVSVSLIDIIFQLIYWYINLFLMIDDVAILAISSIYLFFTFKRKKFNILITILTVIICIGGFGCKGFGLTLLNDRIHNNTIPQYLPIVLFMLVVIRSFTIFFYIPITCDNYF